jgi:hypothetical protein
VATSAQSEPAPLALPTMIRATIVSDRRLLITWLGGRADTSYRVYRRRVSPTEEPVSFPIGETLPGGQGLYDSVVEPGAAYEYVVQACEGERCGERSAPVRVRAAVETVAAPQLLALAPESAGELRVTWAPGPADAGTILEVASMAGGAMSDPVQLPPGVQSYLVRDLRPLQTYWVRLRSCTPEGCSPHSEERRVSMPSSLSPEELDGRVPADPQRASVVEGLEAPRTFASAAVAIRSTFQDDRIQIDVEPSDAERFLVVNEVYHPRWRAYADGQELKVWPTNLVMRGLVVPPGVGHVELRFEPFLWTWPAWLSVAAGLLAGAAAWYALRRLDGRSA